MFLGINSPVAPEARPHLLSALQHLPAKHPLQRRSVTLAAHQLLTEAGSTLFFEGKPSTKHGWDILHLQMLEMRILRFLLVSYVLFCSISTQKKNLSATTIVICGGFVTGKLIPCSRLIRWFTVDI